MEHLKKVKQACEVLLLLKRQDSYKIILLLLSKENLRPVQIRTLLGLENNNMNKYLLPLLRSGILTKETHSKKEVIYSINREVLDQVMAGVRVINTAKLLKKAS